MALASVFRVFVFAFVEMERASVRSKTRSKTREISTSCFAKRVLGTTKYPEPPCGR